MASNLKRYTPLRYPGGKSRFAPFISSLMECNDLHGGHYLEPYAGGAGVALELLFHGHASHVHINDLDPAVHAFWCCAKDHTDALIDLLKTTPVNMDEWYKWRSILRGEVEASLLERGFATLFLNRTNRSGILKGGVIGGKNQDGPYKIGARFNKDDLTQRIQRISEFAAHISVYNEDALSLLKRCDQFLPKRSLIYLDPPYYVKGQGLYRNFYVHEDHLAISRTLQSCQFNRSWVVSYDDTPEICGMYKSSVVLRYSLNYTAQTQYMGKEVMFFSKTVETPEQKIPQAKLAA
jgi:DNA adenine methylase